MERRNTKENIAVRVGGTRTRSPDSIDFSKIEVISNTENHQRTLIIEVRENGALIEKIGSTYKNAL